MPIPSHVHPVIRKLREHRLGNEVSTRALAEKLGYNASTIEAAEHARNCPAFQLVVNYADYFGLELILREKRH